MHTNQLSRYSSCGVELRIQIHNHWPSNFKTRQANPRVPFLPHAAGSFTLVRYFYAQTSRPYEVERYLRGATHLLLGSLEQREQTCYSGKV